ncbi:Hypothetical protein LUCI_5061 [Lucifera butyrica]|uniref:DNA mismatch repair proteins mutS family domain-containing protein n=1 Tax=Lucifera butyrica TaxID=1351585 RepID=A0A498RI23_9FIRM|nr:DNA mismatch repair protein MutS [Lucifera butyrica]VBB09763.1 Hypothetical protein LUCI_5061 [Lucifera butyrica]
MKAFLMYKDQDFDLQQGLPANEQALTQDLELNTLFNAMALGDQFLFDVARKAILSGLSDLDAIRYRQAILKDCLKNPAVVRELYAIAVETIEKKRQKYYFGIFTRYPAGILHSALEALQMLLDMLKRLKHIADTQAAQFESEGFTAFLAMLKQELTDEYFTGAQQHLKELKFRDGVLLSAELGKGNIGANYVLRKSPDKKESWLQRFLAKKPPAYTIEIHARDESGARSLSELRDRGINLVANALAQSTEHILSFFTLLRTELAFYVGCLNLHGQLVQLGEPIAFPLIAESGEHKFSCRELYDVCLALTLQQKIVGNTVQADHKDLVIITGANQGGKSTFLRSAGLSLLMMQCGMFVPAGSFCSSVCDNLFTHYKREEDPTMTSGKLDEELGRMSDIIDKLSANSIVLFNESFAATNEREGSEIARQILGALLQKRIRVFCVTHLYEFAHGFYEQKKETVLFLRAERQNDGKRTFRLAEGEPLQTSFGEDLYINIFGSR